MRTELKNNFMTQNYLTKERLTELKKELTGLKTRVRQEIAERLKHAKEMGDLSENSEFTSAKEDQRWLENRVNQLEDLIRNATLIHKPLKSQTVKIGSTIKAQKKNQIFVYTIVGSEDAQPTKGLISNQSPLGRAFLGKKIGDIIKAETPIGHAEYKILEIE
jgi:transcription elongation factor GreA